MIEKKTTDFEDALNTPMNTQTFQVALSNLIETALKGGRVPIEHLVFSLEINKATLLNLVQVVIQQNQQSRITPALIVPK